MILAVAAISLTVIICTHNPRADYLARVLAALRAQTLPASDWELLLIDNASAEPLAGKYDLSWHPNARHIREDELGLTPARLRGIAEARGDLLVFVDDDNVLAADYLEQALAIAGAWPILGAWGAGAIEGQFEVEPAPWMQPLLNLLCIRKFSEATWSNNREDWGTQPCGAGICVRSSVAKAYSTHVATRPWHRCLGRIGQSLSSGEDADLVLTGCDLGFGFGCFPQLALVHLIPSHRLTPSYMLRLLQGVRISGALLRYYRWGVLPQVPNRFRTTIRYLLMLLTKDHHQALIYKASQDAAETAARIALELPNIGQDATPEKKPWPLLLTR